MIKLFLILLSINANADLPANEAQFHDRVMQYLKEEDSGLVKVQLAHRAAIYHVKPTKKNIMACLERATRLQREISLRVDLGSLEILACWPTPVKGP